MGITAEQRAQQLSQRDDNDIIWLMKTPEGRRIMNRILTTSGFESLCMTGNSYTFFNDGRRSVGQPFYQSVLNLCPHAFIEMLKEAKSEVKETEELTNHDH
jgi:hypothetical protein